LKKTTKLLSVLLAVVMMFSCFTMAAFAAKANYQTSANLESLGAYSPDGAATRFTTEERMSILFDWLDMVLYDVDFEGIHVNQSVLFWTIKLDVTINSVDEICASADSIKELLEGTVASIGSSLNLIGQADQATFKSWTKGTRRSGAQLSIVSQLLNVLKDNQGLVDTILNDKKIDLGMINGYISLVSINKIVADIPGFILSKVYPLLSRRDDTKAMANDYFNGAGNPSTVLNNFANRLFQMPQSDTTYKEDASGNCVSGHTLPTASNALRYYYVKDGDTITPMVWDAEKQQYKADEVTYEKTADLDADGNPTGLYIYQSAAGDNLKYFKNGSYWLPSFVGQSFNVNTESLAALLYKFAPYVFADLAPIAANGFLKKTLAEWMGATFTKFYEGKAGTAEAAAALATVPASVQSLFTDAVPYYQFSYSNYAVADENTHYYRYVDKDTNTEEWFVGDMTTGNEYLSLFNFNYHVDGDFLDEFIPTSATSSWTILQNLNDFAIKVAQTALKPEEFAKLNLQPGNENFVANIRNAAQVFLPLQPDAILGPDYLVHYDGYYQTLISTTATDDEVFASLAAIIAKALMPQLILPSADKLAGQKVGAVLACVVRELVTQFVPTYNYDALIFTDYNTRTLVAGKDNSYWLDVILTMGVDVGMTYLTRLADTGSDDNTGFEAPESKTYDLATFEANPQAWENSVDWIIDWALSTNKEWTWNIQNLVDVNGLTVNMGSAQDPWVKLDKILNDLLPLKQIINCTAADGKTWLETVLRDKLILGIADMNFGYIFGSGSKDAPVAGLLSIPSNSILRTKGALVAVFEVVRDLLNKVIYKVAGNTNLFATGTFTNIDSLVGKNSSGVTNLKLPIDVLLSKLPTAYSNGLLQTVLPILEMFVGWKTGTQELVDPKVSWNNTYIPRSGSAEMTFTNTSAGMLLKHWKADGSYVYEKAYNMIIDNISSSDLNFTVKSGSTTVAPYGRTIYTVKPKSTSGSTDVATKLTITYHYTGKDGSSIGGTQTATQYIVISSNETIVGEFKDNYKKQSGLISKTDQVNMDVKYAINAFVTSREDLEKAVTEDIKVEFTNNCEKAATFSTFTFTPGGSSWLAHSGERNNFYNKTIPGGDTWIYHPVKLAKDESEYVSGTGYSIGTIYFTAKQGSYSAGTSSSNAVDLQKMYFADMGDLVDLFNAEAGKNRVASDYNTASLMTAYDNAMKDAAILCTAPVVDSGFSTRYAASNIEAKTTALQNAVSALDADKKPSTGNIGILENGLAAGETASLIGADGQINFQDFDLYGYWKYEDNRTQARNILKEYEGPVRPEAFIDGCWLPYTDSEKHEDLSTVIANEANTTKVDAINASMTQPSEKELAAYADAVAEYKTPEYTQLYVSDIANKLDFFNDVLVPRAYSGVAAGRAQLAQEIAYANAQNYNEADYTAKSWARYQNALTAAQAANVDGTMQSYVFQAKYDLLKAQRDLRLAAYDYETQVGFEALQALVDLAEGMFANADYFTAVDGTLDTEWTDLIEALGYTATFGSGNDAWSMNLYAKSAGQLVTEELDVRSARNEQRVEDVTAALQAAIDALKCTIEVVKNDDTTIVDQEVKYITNITPLALTGVDAVLAHVRATSNAATLTVTATANGYGTGTTVAATLNGIPIVNYFVVIYGDINGDNAIDGFDAARADAKLVNGASFNAPQEKAADATKDGSFDVADVSAIISAGAGNTDINQA